MSSANDSGDEQFCETNGFDDLWVDPGTIASEPPSTLSSLLESSNDNHVASPPSAELPKSASMKTITNISFPAKDTLLASLPEQRYASDIHVSDSNDINYSVRASKMKDTSLSVMVIGDYGLGKTSFVKTLFHIDPSEDLYFDDSSEEAHSFADEEFSDTRSPDVYSQGESEPEEATLIDDGSDVASVHKSSQDEAAVDQDEDFEDEVQDLNSRQHSMVEILGDEVRLARARINVPQPEIKISQKYIEEPVNYSAGNDRVRVRLQIITCPKFGSFANNLNAWAPIIKYIEDQHLLYMLQEEQPSRTQLVDNRVHACVYFISPNSNGLKPLDAHVMKLLHTKVNLIPVIAKADSYSRDELTTTKKRVNDALKQEKIHVFRPPGYNDVHDDNRHYPFAIITEETPGSGGRCYAPGLASVSDLNHCDFVRLKRLLIEQHMVDLIEETDSRYLPFRKELMYKRIEAARMDNNGYPQTHLSFDGGLETFRHISKAEYGHDFLREQQLQTDLVYNTYVDGLKEAVRRTVNYYDKRFRDWRRELAEKQDEMEDELVRLNKGNESIGHELKLQEHIRRTRRTGIVG